MSIVGVIWLAGMVWTEIWLALYRDEKFETILLGGLAWPLVLPGLIIEKCVVRKRPR